MFSLIDSGSTYSYVLSEHAYLLDIPVDVLDVGVVVTSSLGETVTVRRLYRKCPLEVQGHVFAVDLMELPFHGFDLILGVDWLTKHRAMVDFEKKRVTLRLLDGSEVVVKSEYTGFLSNVVSALQAERLMQHGGIAYLAYVMNPGIGEVRV